MATEIPKEFGSLSLIQGELEFPGREIYPRDPDWIRFSTEEWESVTGKPFDKKKMPKKFINKSNLEFRLVNDRGEPDNNGDMVALKDRQLGGEYVYYYWRGEELSLVYLEEKQWTIKDGKANCLSKKWYLDQNGHRISRKEIYRQMYDNTGRVAEKRIFKLPAEYLSVGCPQECKESTRVFFSEGGGPVEMTEIPDPEMVVF